MFEQIDIEGNIAYKIAGSSVFYSVVSKDNKMCYNPYTCKDYIQNIYHAAIHKNYGLGGGLLTNNVELDLEGLKLLVFFPGKNDEQVVKLLSMVHQLDEFIGASKTKLYKEKRLNGWMFQTDKIWILSPTLISFYALTLRVLYNNDSSSIKEAFQLESRKSLTRDCAVCSNLIKYDFIGENIRKLIPKSDDLKANFPLEAGYSNMHSQSGISALINHINYSSVHSYCVKETKLQELKSFIKNFKT